MQDTINDTKKMECSHNKKVITTCIKDVVVEILDK